VNFLSTYSDKKSCHTSITWQTSIARFVSHSWASCSTDDIPSCVVTDVAAHAYVTLKLSPKKSACKNQNDTSLHSICFLDNFLSLSMVWRDGVLNVGNNWFIWLVMWKSFLCWRDLLIDFGNWTVGDTFTAFGNARLLVTRAMCIAFLLPVPPPRPGIYSRPTRIRWLSAELGVS